jgi:hypothetical protein
VTEGDHHYPARGASQLTGYGIRGVLGQEQRAPHFAGACEVSDPRVLHLLRVSHVRA